MRNPFENHGNPVFGEEFIGRKEILEFLRERLVAPRLAGCAGVFGQPRVGKTSLAYQAVVKNTEAFLPTGKLPLRLSIRGVETPEEFFYSLVETVAQGLTKQSWEIPDRERLTSEAQRSGPGHLIRLENFFGALIRAGYQCVIVLDDFDGAAHLFKGRADCFEKLRVLGSEERVSWLTLSRRNIYEIEDRATGGSIFAGIVDQNCLGLFDDKEFLAFLDRLKGCFGNVSEDDVHLIRDACGHQPHLLAMVGSDLVEANITGVKRSIEDVLESRVTDFLTNYDHTVAALRDDRRLGKVFQILFGPAFDVENEDIKICVSYGLIRLDAIDPKAGPEFVAYSQRFGDYLRSIERRQVEGDVWGVWFRTETALRLLVVRSMTSKYGENWEVALEKVRPERSKMLDQWRERQTREEKTLGTTSMNVAIDYAHVADLFTLIFDEWKSLKSLFGQTDAYWRLRADTLIRVRIALAHNRRVFRDQKTQVQACCEEFLRVLQPKP